jgi:hypothetical protein
VEEAVEQNQADLAQMASSLGEMSSMMQSGATNSSPLGLDPQQQARMEQLIQDLSVRADSPRNVLSPAQRKKLAQTLQQCKGCKGGNRSIAGLKEAATALAKELEGKCQSSCPGGENYGRGGIDRGRGDAPYVLGQENRLEQAKYEEKSVENQFLASEDLVDMGIIPIEPKPDPGKFAPGTLRQFSPTQGSQVSRTRISPSQREVVSKYFGK